jgi:hypothetical protein
MRLLFRLLVILALCLVAIGLPATAAQAAGPYITLFPDNGVPGTNVTVRGYNFTADKEVDICYCPTTACSSADRMWVAEEVDTEDGDFTVKVTIPESYTGTHELRAYISTNTSPQATGNFTVTPGLTVSPQKGPVGTTVTVEGHGFAKDEGGIELRYYLNSSNYTTKATNIQAADYGWWTRSFVIPASAKGSYKIDAKGASGNNTLNAVEDAFFEVTPGISLSKLSGSPGESITVTGNGFWVNDREITILFDGNEVNAEVRVDADANGHWDKDFDVPDMPKGTYNVTAYGEKTPKESISARSFAIKPDIVLSAVQGYVGMNLSVAGRGFAVKKAVNIMYDGDQVATDTTDNTGSFDVVFPVPESQHGAHQVTAEIGGETEATRSFTMESNPPDTPQLISPPDRSRVGLIGKVTPKFEWSAVSDPSGVYYNLQIATSDNVTVGGGFADPIVPVQGLVTTNYTLNATEGLPYGTYYWIVQAVDRAGNAGNWTEACSFRAGLLPPWGVIAAIVAIVILIGALVYFFVIRKRTPRYY